MSRLARPGNDKRFYLHDVSVMSSWHDDDRIIAVQPTAICFSWEKQVSVAPKDVYRPSIFFSPHHYPLALAVNKSPAVYILSPVLDGLCEQATCNVTFDVNAKPGQSLCFHTSELPLCIIRIMNGPRPRPRLRPLVLYIQTKIRKKMNDGMNSWNSYNNITHHHRYAFWFEIFPETFGVVLI